LMRDSEIMDTLVASTLEKDNKELIRMLVSSIKTAKSRMKIPLILAITLLSIVGFWLFTFSF
jgi:hypothetical protein